MIHFRPEQSIIGPKTGHFGQSVPENGLPSSRTGTYWKTKGIQSYLRTWEIYSPIESVLPEAKKEGYLGVASKKTDFWAKNAISWAKTVFFGIASHLFVNITTDEQKGNFLC